MPGSSTDHFGGNVLLIGGILYAIAVTVHPDITTLGSASAANLGRWAFVHLAYLLGDVLMIAGLVVLCRHLAVTGTGSSGGWAAVALAGGLVGFSLDAAATGIHLFSFPPTLPAATPNLQNIFDAASAVITGIDNAGYLAVCLGLVALGVALRKEGWSPVVAVGAMAVGAIELFLAIFTNVTGTVLFPVGIIAIAVNALMPVCYAAVGATFATMGTK